MKVIVFIMAFLVLALSVMPCADADIKTTDGKAKTELTKSNHEAGNPQQDDCSPFCQCSCCAGFCINHFITSIIITLPFGNKIKPAFLPSGILDIALPIWQPPQLV